MKNELNPTTLAKFQALEIKSIDKIKGGDGEDPDPNGLIGTDDIADT